MMLPRATRLVALVPAIGRPHPVTVVLLAGALALITANAVLGLSYFLTSEKPGGTFARAVGFNVEQNLPTLYGSTLLIIASVLLARVAWRRLDAAGAAGRDARYWAAFAVGFAYLAVDEVAMLHTRLLPPLIGDPQLRGAFRGEWVIPALALVVLVGVVFRPFLRRLPAITRALFVLAGLVYVGGAIGGEIAGGLAYELAGSGALSGSAVLAEEGLELLGVALFIHALLAMPRVGAEEAG